jgi:serine/threonine-protein kinase
MDETLDLFGWVGATVDGKYRVDAVVGQGGFGIVYRAHHLGFDQTVALKCLKLPQTLMGAERDRFRETFLAEGRLLHQLSRADAGIVQALDLGAAVSPNKRWTPYLVLEWLEGRPLDRDFAERRASGAGGRSINEAIGLLTSAARALAVAHAQGVAHRDIKPANLFLADVAGRTVVKVLDFGIAKVMSESESVTRAFEETGASPGAFTARYGAPEQFSRRFGATGPWTDVFALALVFVEAVINKPALDGRDATQLFVAAADADRRPTLRTLGHEDVSDAVEAVLARALAVDPRARYATAGEFWDALESAAQALSDESAAFTRRRSFSAYAETATGHPVPAPVLEVRAPSTGDRGAPAATQLSSSQPISGTTSPRRANGSAWKTVTRLGIAALLLGGGAAAGLELLRSHSLDRLPHRSIPSASATNATATSASPSFAPTLVEPAPTGGPSSQAGAVTPVPSAPLSVPADAPSDAASGFALPGPLPSAAVNELSAPPAASAVEPSNPQPGSVAPLGGTPRRDVPPGPIGEAFIGGYPLLARESSANLDFFAAEKQCGELGMALCTQAQWEHACSIFPDLAPRASWTASLQGDAVVVRGGESCATSSRATPEEHAEARFGTCCDRAIAMTTDNLQKPYLTTTAGRVLAIERALNQRNVNALLELCESTLTVDGRPKTPAAFRALVEAGFRSSPGVVILNDTCKVSVQAKKLTKRVHKKKHVVYQTQGWTAECRQTEIAPGKVTTHGVTYGFSAASKLREITTKPLD